MPVYRNTNANSGINPNIAQIDINDNAMRIQFMFKKENEVAKMSMADKEKIVSDIEAAISGTTATVTIPSDSAKRNLSAMHANTILITGNKVAFSKVNNWLKERYKFENQEINKLLERAKPILRVAVHSKGARADSLSMPAGTPGIEPKAEAKEHKRANSLSVLAGTVDAGHVQPELKERKRADSSSVIEQPNIFQSNFIFVYSAKHSAIEKTRIIVEIPVGDLVTNKDKKFTGLLTELKPFIENRRIIENWNFIKELFDAKNSNDFEQLKAKAINELNLEDKAYTKLKMAKPGQLTLDSFSEVLDVICATSISANISQNDQKLIEQFDKYYAGEKTQGKAVDRAARHRSMSNLSLHIRRPSVSSTRAAAATDDKSPPIPELRTPVKAAHPLLKYVMIPNKDTGMAIAINDLLTNGGVEAEMETSLKDRASWKFFKALCDGVNDPKKLATVLFDKQHNAQLTDARFDPIRNKLSKDEKILANEFVKIVPLLTQQLNKRLDELSATPAVKMILSKITKDNGAKPVYKPQATSQSSLLFGEPPAGANVGRRGTPKFAGKRYVAGAEESPQAPKRGGREAFVEAKTDSKKQTPKPGN